MAVRISGFSCWPSRQCGQLKRLTSSRRSSKLIGTASRQWISWCRAATMSIESTRPDSAIERPCSPLMTLEQLPQRTVRAVADIGADQLKTGCLRTAALFNQTQTGCERLAGPRSQQEGLFGCPRCPLYILCSFRDSCSVLQRQQVCAARPIAQRGSATLTVTVKFHFLRFIPSL